MSEIAQFETLRKAVEDGIEVEAYEFPEDSLYCVGFYPGLCGDHDLCDKLETVVKELAQTNPGIDVGSGARSGGFTVACKSEELRMKTLAVLDARVTDLVSKEVKPEHRNWPFQRGPRF